MLSDFLRYERGLTGTKVVCAEGDCGACTVLSASVHDCKEGRWNFKPVNSCIMPVFSLDGCFLVTVEGLKMAEKLHPVQTAMLDHFGSQCGYCTPGFICAMTALAEDCVEKKIPITEKRSKNAMTGNLCRCTGYEPIINAALALDLENFETLQDRFHDLSVVGDLKTSTARSAHIVFGQREVCLPITLQEALQFKQKHPEAIIAAGSTDLGVAVNKGRGQYQVVITLQNIPGLREIQKHADHLVIPCRVTLTALQKYLQDEAPEMSRMLNIFASPQIKNSATLVGNVVNASPISDTIPFLLVSDAQLELQSTSGKRLVPMDSFYLAYKKMDLKPDEIVTAIHLPLPTSTDFIKLYKVSLRKDLDISAVTMAVHVQRVGTQIAKARLAFGGVGPTVSRIKEVEDEWMGQEFKSELFEAAARDIHLKVKPISDVRGSKDYRLLLCRNLLRKCANEMSEVIQ